MSYGTNLPDQFRRAGDHVDKILRGAKPGDSPVEQPIIGLARWRPRVDEIAGYRRFLRDRR